MVKSLIVGYGNSLRSDDGIGVRVAEIVTDWNVSGLQTRSLHQLTPELAEDLAGVDLAIFVDAAHAVDGDSVKLYDIKPADSSIIRSHFGDPRALLSLTQAIYGKCPQAWWLVVPGVNFQIGDRLSAVAQQGVLEALEQIRRLISQ